MVAGVELHHVPPVEAGLQPLHPAALPELQDRVLIRLHPDRFQSPTVRQALQPEFACETPGFLGVELKSRLAEPDAPIVLVSRFTGAVGLLIVGRRRLVFSPPKLGDQLRQFPFEQLAVCLFDRNGVRPVQVIQVLPSPLAPRLLGLVVARPDGQRRPVSQPDHLFPGFRQEIHSPGGIGRHHGARIHEVLPDQNAVLVTEVVQHLLAIVRPAPDADHVHVGRHRIVDDATPPPLSANGKEIGRNHIGPADLHRDPIDHALHGLTEAVQPPVPFHGPNPEPHRIKAPLPVFQSQVIERLFPHAIGPPQGRLGNRQAIPSPIDSVPPAGHIDPIALQRGSNTLHRLLKEDLVFSLFRSNGHRNEAERGQLLVDSNPPHGLPDAAGHEPGSPVPSKVVLGLAAEDAVLLSDGTRLIAHGNRQRRRLQQRLPHPHRAPEHHLQRVLACQPQLLRRETPSAMHVVRVEHSTTIHLQLCMRVEPAEFQGPLAFCRRQGQGPAIAPIPILDPLDLTLIHTVERIGNQAMAKQIGVHASRHLRRSPYPSGILKGPVSNELDFARIRTVGAA